MRILLSPIICCAIFLASCSQQPDPPLRVRQFHLKKTSLAHHDAMMVRGEQQYRLRGAVTAEEQNNRLGQYYTCSWNFSAGVPTHIVMEYRQSATGSKTLTKTHRISPQTKIPGKVEFAIAGDEYQANGRVIAWRIRLMSNEKTLAEKRSYLWK